MKSITRAITATRLAIFGPRRVVSILRRLDRAIDDLQESADYYKEQAHRHRHNAYYSGVLASDADSVVALALKMQSRIKDVVA